MSTERGHAAETAAAEYLAARGLTILDRNWRNRWCEIDIVAAKDGVLHLVEVKFRHRSDYGTGFEAINTDKRQRLERAAEAYAATHHFDGTIQVDVVSVSGEPGWFVVDWLESALT